MILSGEKTEEYRDIKPHWENQFLFRICFPPSFTPSCGFMSASKDLHQGNYDFKGWKEVTGGAPVFNNFDTITFSNGYAKDRDQFIIECKGIEVRQGNPDWGAEDGTNYFVIKLGKVITTQP
jgi:hypothetical protein